MPKLILFDIDGTLIHSGGAGVLALNLAFEDLTGISDGFREVNCAGKTDSRIVREGLDIWGLGVQDGLALRLIDRYLAHLEGTTVQCKGHVKPGVMPLLQRLQGTEGLSLGLLTGNIEQGARIKLEPYGLNPFFPMGAFGSDHEDRNCLLPFAVKRYQEREGVPISYAECLVIGDTPLDVICAKTHGAPSIAVATGPYSVEALQETGAELVVPDLTNTDGINRWIVENQASVSCGSE